MKRLFLICSMLFPFVSSYAQVPQRVTFQAVIRDNSNSLIVNSPVGIKVSILKDSVTGIPDYIESHLDTTNSNGLSTIEIGGGIPILNSFSNIDWADGSHFLKTEIDPLGGTNYTISGISQLLSVPYALYSKKTEFSNSTGGIQVDTLTSSDISVNVVQGLDVRCLISSLSNNLLTSMYDLSCIASVNGVFYSISTGYGFVGTPNVGDLIEFKIYIHTTHGIKYFYQSYIVI